MTYTITDRRKNGTGKSIPNRQRFLKRVSLNIKEMMQRSIRHGKISDITGNGQKVRVPAHNVKEPSICHGHGGVKRRVLPYNIHFIEGDRLDRPEEDGFGSGSGSGPGDTGYDEFTFTLTKEEFLNFFFEDLELPDLTDKKINTEDEFRYKRTGFSCTGNPSRLDILKSMREAVGRRLALSAKDRKQLRELKNQLAELNQQIYDCFHLGEDAPLLEQLQQKQHDLQLEIIAIRHGIKIPFVDDIDLRFRQWTKEPVPATQAVMFCLMDVSFSMSEWHKDLAKRFFMLLYLFLYRGYEKIELVFIRYHDSAREVTEHEFFYDTETGGTVVSSGLELLVKIAKERYNTAMWNIYVAHASDGDTWSSDIPLIHEYFQQILKMAQYYFYVEVSRRDQSELMDVLSETTGKNFAIARISDASEIWPVFRGLFEKKQ